MHAPARRRVRRRTTPVVVRAVKPFAHAPHWNSVRPGSIGPAATAPTAAVSASSAITGQTGESPRASISAGFQRTTGAPAATSAPSTASSSKPAPSRFTVSIPRCTSTPRPPAATTTKACGLSLTRVPAIGETTVSGPRSGSTAAPRPTIACAKTGSGTSRSSIAVPDSGAPTSRTVVVSIPVRCVVRLSEQVLDVHTEGVGLRPDHHLYDRARLHHAVRPGRLERGVADLRAVPDHRAKPGDARFDLHDVVGSAEPGDDRLCLVHHSLHYGSVTRAAPRRTFGVRDLDSDWSSVV